MKRTIPRALAFTSAMLFVIALFPMPASAGDGFLNADPAIPPARTKVGRSGQSYHWKPGC
jgi:hypothetical protein